jgi:hypothetical protein
VVEAAGATVEERYDARKVVRCARPPVRPYRKSRHFGAMSPNLHAELLAHLLRLFEGGAECQQSV